MPILATKLKNLRKQQHLTQTEVAHILGCTPAAISHYEAGIRVPPVNKLARLADIYNTTIDYITRDTRH